jgi:hypothetical protein
MADAKRNAQTGAKLNGSGANAMDAVDLYQTDFRAKEGGLVNQRSYNKSYNKSYGK